ncbi:unnamed protein product, partial [Prorocentrum cordatum]
ENRPGAPEHEVSPETAVAKETDTRSCFVRPAVRRGLLPSILERLLAARKQAKKALASVAGASIDAETKRKVLNGRQLALKLSANSVYGFTGAMNGPLPCLELAGAVTAYGREMIQSTKRKVESHFVQANGFRYDAQVVYGDTDSVMVRFGPEELSLQDAMDLSAKAAEVCSAEFPSPARLEFEKVYRPYLLMAKKRYAGLAFASPDSAPKLDTKGIETVRRDWSDLVRQGLERTLHLLLRPDGQDGVASAISYVRNLCDEVRQNKVDFRALIISKSLGRDEYAAKLPHVTVAEKLRKRDPASAPSIGDRVPYLVLGGAAKSNVNERAEDPLYALEHELPIDAEYYLEKQLKQPLIRVFELVLGSAQKAEQELFGAAPAERKVVASAGISTLGGMGKFMKPRLKCLDCGAATTPDGQSFCDLCSKKGPVRAQQVREEATERARGLRKDLGDLRAHCEQRCAVPPGSFLGLPPDPPREERPAEPDGRERCDNLNCQVIFRRVRVAKELKAASDALARLKPECGAAPGAAGPSAAAPAMPPPPPTLRFLGAAFAALWQRGAPQAAPGATPWLFPATWRTRLWVAPVDRMLGLCGNRSLTDADLATFWLASRWGGFENRTDLALLRAQGTRALVLHRCVVEPDLLRAFLDRAYTEGLTVFAELPRRLFVQEPSGCLHSGYDCFLAVRAHWRELLATPLVEERGGRRYHPALEAALLFQGLDAAAAAAAGAGCDAACSLQGALQALVTGWDGLLDAEVELGVAPGRTRVAATLPSAAASGAEGSSTEQRLCYRRRASEGGCAGQHTLRSFWLNSQRLPNASWQPHAPHQNLSAHLPARWLHTFGAGVPLETLLQVLRDYEEFVDPPSDGGTPSALLEFRP